MFELFSSKQRVSGFSNLKVATCYTLSVCCIPNSCSTVCSTSIPRFSRFPLIVPVNQLASVVSVRCPCTDDEGGDAIMSTIDSGHLGALYGGQEGTEEAGLV